MKGRLESSLRGLLSAWTGFTLLELLVVVSIIGVLVSLLLPALQKAKDSARALGCMSNEKQFSYAMICYANDYNTYIPPYYVSGYPAFGDTWKGLMYPYMSGKTAKLDVTAFRCPGYPFAQGKPTWVYSYYAWASAWRRLTYSPSGLAPNVVVYISDKNDGTWDDGGSGWTTYGWPKSSLPSHRRHNLGANYLFLDAHVEWKKRASEWTWLW